MATPGWDIDVGDAEFFSGSEKYLLYLFGGNGKSVRSSESNER